MKKIPILLAILLIFCSCGKMQESIENTEQISESIAQPTIEPTVEPTVVPTIEPTVEESEEIKESSEVEIMFEKALDTTFEFIKDGKDKPGIAQGIISVTPLENAFNFGYYIVYFANDTEVLQEYDAVACMKMTGNTVYHEIKDGLFLPNEATKLAVFENNIPFFDDIPDITLAGDIIDIPNKDKIDLGEVKSKFAAISDVHMNYDDYDRGASVKFKNALDFFYESKAEYVIVAGDMTGDENLDVEYQRYVSIINESNYDFNDVYECIGNHGNTPEKIGLMNKYTKGSNQVHPYEDSPYYYTIIQGKDESEKDNMFIFMAQELNAPGDTAKYDNFSKEQIDWFESVLKENYNDKTNIFVILHSPFLNYGAGDRHPSGYGGLVKFDTSFTQTMRLKALLESHKNVIVLSGHTHLTFYDGQNYSDENDTFCRMVHISSTCQPNSYNDEGQYVRNTDGRYEVTPDYGSEGYLVEVYEDYILFKGYNLISLKIIPASCILIPTKAYESEKIDETKEFYDSLNGSGTIKDPYQISSAREFYEVTNQFNKSYSTIEEEMFGYGKYFIQTNNIDMKGYLDYQGTYANGNGKCFFAGNYNGNGYSLNVEIVGSNQRSIFPYCNGTISNLIVTGSIQGIASAQVVRTLYGQIINCIFDVDLISKIANGICYSNYGFIYNVYTNGLLKGENKNPISSNDSSSNYYNVFYNRYDENGTVISDEYGISTNDLMLVSTSFNNYEHEKYNSAIEYLNGVGLCASYIEEERLLLENE